MRVRVRFSKYGSQKFLGHLDVLRYFQKAIRRSGLSVAYSEGYHPHQIMSFAQPLSLACTSDGEYFDVEFVERYSEEELTRRLSQAVGSGFAVSKVTILKDYVMNTKKVTSMSLISAAAYCILAKKETGITEETIRTLGSMEHFPILRKTKTTEKEFDLISGIRELYTMSNAGLSTVITNESPLMNEHVERDGITHVECSPDETSLICVLDAGSERNVSADLVCAALCKLAEADYKPTDFTIHRMELYGHEGEKELPLWQITI